MTVLLGADLPVGTIQVPFRAVGPETLPRPTTFGWPPIPVLTIRIPGQQQTILLGTEGMPSRKGGHQDLLPTSLPQI